VPHLVRRLPARLPAIHVQLTMTGTRDVVSQSFLIMEHQQGLPIYAQLTGYEQSGSMPRLTTVPVTIRARLS
jgi:hypothetical protein